MILNDEFKDEIKLNEVQIATMLDVSPTPVREAFRMLAADGIVEIIPWKGVFIKKYTIDEVEEAYQCREVLETLAVKLCINIIPRTEIDRLLNLLKENTVCLKVFTTGIPRIYSTASDDIASRAF